MPLRFSFHKHVLEFNFDARTSRGIMKDRTSWFIKIWNESDEGIFGLGESAPLAGLSKETHEDVELELVRLEKSINASLIELPKQELSLGDLAIFIKSNFNTIHSSNRFAFETALLDLMHKGRRVLFQTEFTSGKPIPINGLIWMGGLDKMLQQIDIKIKDGFRCIKLKVGGHDFEKECDILQYIRRKYFRENIIVRLDANGAFKPEDALYKLNLLTRFTIHSIEQPIKPGHPAMEELCAKTPIPIALDEELLGIDALSEKQVLLNRLKPAYIIIKPSLHGGLHAAHEWIQVAEKAKIGWWLTSSLESTIGLNAIAQFASTFALDLPQGLGTGAIYSNNFPSPLVVKESTLIYNHQIEWDLRQLFPKESLYIDE
jgi:o-succinylbenzoate synthase